MINDDPVRHIGKVSYFSLILSNSNDTLQNFSLDLANWYAVQRDLHESAHQTEEESFNLRYKSESVILESNIKTKWNNVLNDDRLSDR